ncbi:hypothetical protein H4582DRAFT_2103491 [Lactarius indigo]|nr:hypothetical protein H4582DRAFT_2103491 [Lactarius indigo]
MKSQCEAHGHAICATTINTLTGDVLLEIFDLIRSSSPTTDFQIRYPRSWDAPPVWKWHPLVHVCRRWREIIFESPLRLDLQVLCTHGTPVRKDLGCWPPNFPIAIGHGYNSTRGLTPEDEDNVFAALEQRGRVRHINLSVTDVVLEKVATLMLEPFPELRDLAISSRSQNMPILPDGFLGGSAPSLRQISFDGIPFPALPTFISSASNLAKLILVDIPQTGYISSVGFVACLAALPRLEHLSIEFQSGVTSADRTQPPFETRAVLPSLTSFVYMGESAFLEAIVARVDTPQLDSIDITYAYADDLDFQVTELSKFIERSVLKPSPFGHAKIPFECEGICFYFFGETNPDLPTIGIRTPSSDWIPELVSHMAEVLNQASGMLSDVVRLEVTIESSSPFWRDDIGEDIDDDTEWLGLFRPFTAVKKLYICEELGACITRALEGRTEEANTQVLPSLKSICVEDENTREGRERGRLLSNGDEGLDPDDSDSGKHLTPDDDDNMFTTLEIREIRERTRLLRLSMTDGVLVEAIKLMQKPFPELRNLAISSYPGRDTRGLDEPSFPNDFLGGSAPSLQEISFNGIRFPALPTFLSSASDLVKLTLVNIPNTTYFPPAAFAACLAVLPRLEHLCIGFQSRHSRTTGNRTHLPPWAQDVLPSLTSFTFVGESACLEVVVHRVDTPQLGSIDITYTDQEDFEVSELLKFIERSGIKPSQFGHAEISLEHDNEEIDQLVNIMARALNQTSTMLSDVVRLEITFDRDWKLDDDETVHDIERLELFRPFTAVKKLRIYEKLAESISYELEGQTEEVLPTLESICKEDQRPARGMKELIADLLQRGKLLSSGGDGLDSDDSE